MSNTKTQIISSLVSSTLQRALQATGLISSEDAQASHRSNWEQLYKVDPAAYERHRGALLTFVKSIIEPSLEETVDPHRYSLSVSSAAAVPSVYPSFVEVIDQGSGYDITLPNGSLDLGTIVLARGGGASTIRLVPGGGETINGATSLTLPSTHGAVMIARVTSGWVALT